MKLFLFLLCFTTLGFANTTAKPTTTTPPPATKTAAKPAESADKKEEEKAHSPAIPSIESQLSSISQAQMDYVTKFNKLLDFVDKREKREQAYNSLKTTIKKDVLNIDTLESLFYLSLKLLIVYILHYILRVSIKRMIKFHMESLLLKRQKSTSQHKYKIHKAIITNTIAPLITKIAVWLLRLITVIIVLDILKINVFPLLFGFSLMCIAIAVASKNMLQDLIHGIFIIMRGIVAVGEVVKIGDTKGTVEELNLRSLILRVATGEIEVVPFSSITRIINYSREMRIFKSEIIVDFHQDIQVVEQCYKDALIELKNLALFDKRIENECSFLGISEFREVGCKVVAIIRYAPDPTDNIGIKYNELVHKHLRLNHVEFPKLGYALA